MTVQPARLAAASLAAVLALAALTGCQSAPATTVETAHPSPVTSAEGAPTSPAAPSTPASRAAPTDEAVDRVLAISIDGLNPRALTTLGPGRTPAFHRLMREGASTLNARTEHELTKTLPNHTGMLTGRRIDEDKAGHGIDMNSDTGTTVHKQADHYVASIFDVVHDRGGRTALFSAKTKFELYERTWNTDGAPDTVGRDNGSEKIDRVVLDTDNARLVRTANADLKKSARDFTFLHLSLPDLAGHEHGFMGKRYLAAVEETDELLGSVLDTVSAAKSLEAHTLVVLTADHGGDGDSHSNRKKLQNYRIPFMVWGAGVPGNRSLYALSPARQDPGTSRPTYEGRQPVRNGDVANLAADVLDLPAVPGSELNRDYSLNVFGR